MNVKKTTKKIFILAIILLPIPILAEKSTVFRDNTDITKEITTNYFNAYMGLDFDSMKTMMHDNISFEDPTARFVFGGSKIENKVSVYENFKESYASISEMNQQTVRTIFSSSTGIFEIDLEWKMKNGPDKIITISMPLIVVLRVENGKIISHLDYGDYNYFIEQYNNQVK